MSKKYQAVWEHSKAITLLTSIHKLLNWDQRTYLPENGAPFRATQCAHIASMVHEKSTSAPFKQVLAQLIDLETGTIMEQGLTHTQKVAIRHWRKDFIQANKLSNEFVSEFAHTKAAATHVWEQAKVNNDFKSFVPSLTKVVEMSRKKADLLGYNDHPYDALVDLYEPNCKTSTLEALFSDLKPFLIELVAQVGSKENKYQNYLQGDFPEEEQMKFNHLLLKTMGVESGMSRLDLSSHPFCTGIHPTDVRLTTHIIEGNSITKNIFAVLHEGGHALYELGLPQAHYGTPLCQTISLGLHESQSRWWEVMIGKSKAFWKHMYPHLQVQFPTLHALSLANFYEGINHVQPSPIRIYADEVTYPLHVILRFEIEKGLIEGTIQVPDIPEIWNEKMEKYLGITPISNAQGCLQDIHWSMGHIGYFPTYALGTIYAAQFFECFVKAFPSWEEKVAKGEISFIRQWLLTHIHQHGRMYTTDQLLHHVTGKGVTINPYKSYLAKKFSNQFCA